MDEMGSRYTFFYGPVYLIVIDKNTKCGWLTSAQLGLATTKLLANAMQTC